MTNKFQTLDEFLEHEGVKGMKWGVRKVRRTGRVAPRATLGRRAKRSFSFIDGTSIPNNDSRVKAYDRTYRKAAPGIRAGVRTINKSYKYKDQDFRVDSPLRRSYYKDVSKMMEMQLNAAATKKGRSPDRQFMITFSFDAERSARPVVTVQRRTTRENESIIRKGAKRAKKDFSYFEGVNKAYDENTSAKHADEIDDELDLITEDDDDFEIIIPLKVDDSGYILDIDMPEEVGHAMDLDEFLAHYGVPGMKWGVRRARRSSSGGGKSTVRVKKDGTRVVSRKADPRSLSDADLQKALRRLQMEKQYKDLSKPQVSAGRKLAVEILQESGKAVAKAYVTYALSKGMKKLTKIDIKPESEKKKN